jgi:hypothetical protein
MLEFTIERADQIYRQAMLAGQFNAAISALKELGMLSGKRIERAERGEPGEFDRMSDEELGQAVAGSRRATRLCPQKGNTALNVQFSRSQAIKFLAVRHVGFAPDNKHPSGRPKSTLSFCL